MSTTHQPSNQPTRILTLPFHSIPHPTTTAPDAPGGGAPSHYTTTTTTTPPLHLAEMDPNMPGMDHDMPPGMDMGDMDMGAAVSNGFCVPGGGRVMYSGFTFVKDVSLVNGVQVVAGGYNIGLVGCRRKLWGEARTANEKDINRTPPPHARRRNRAATGAAPARSTYSRAPWWTAPASTPAPSSAPSCWRWPWR